MANLPTDKIFPLLDDNLDLTLQGSYWILDENRTLSWSMSKGLGGNTWNEESYYRSILSGIFETVETYVDVDFDYVGSFGSPMEAYAAGSDHDISIYNFDPSGWAAAMCNFPWAQEESGYTGSAGDMYINGPDILGREGSSGPGTWDWETLLHELGHGLGLKHPHDDGGTGRPTYSDFEFENFDKNLFSLMSYVPVTDGDSNEYNATTPMFIDVLALQYLYGENKETNSGNNTHYVKSTNYFETIWDASGVDTVDASQANAGWEIQLPDTKWSSKIETKTGYACLELEDEMQFPTTLYWLMGEIENAVGSSYRDYLLGNDNQNTLTGNSGDDVIDGAGNIDFATFSGVRTAYQLQGDGGVTTVSDLQGDDGTDTLINVERLSFSDCDYALDTLQWENGGAIYRLYETLFARTPDDDGLTHWLAQADSGMPLTDVAWLFLNSDEFQNVYGIDPSTETLIANLYENALGRESGPEGLAYWVSVFENENISQAQALLGFSESEEHVSILGQTIADGFAYDFA